MATVFDLVKRDSKGLINSGLLDIVLFTPDKLTVFNITGWKSKHAISFDSDGNQVNTKIARVTVDEDVLVANGVTVRNAKGEIALLNYKVKFADSSGLLRSFNVREQLPNQNLGLIMLILEDAII